MWIVAEENNRYVIVRKTLPDAIAKVVQLWRDGVATYKDGLCVLQSLDDSYESVFKVGVCCGRERLCAWTVWSLFDDEAFGDTQDVAQELPGGSCSVVSVPALPMIVETVRERLATLDAWRGTRDASRHLDVPPWAFTLYPGATSWE